MITLVEVPKWQTPKVFTDRARLKYGPTDKMNWVQKMDYLALQKARDVRARDPEMTGLSNTYNEAFYINSADFSTVSNVSAETSLLGGLNTQPLIPAGWWLQQGAQLRSIGVLARGVLNTTSTPTLTFQVRAGTTAGSTFLSGTSLGVSPAITLGSGVSNKWWQLQMELTCRVAGIGTGNATLSGAGIVTSPSGFASPFMYPLEPTTPDTATWTASIDTSITQYLNLSVTFSTASASNSIVCKQLIAYAFG